LDLPPRELEEAIRERLTDCVGIRLLSEVPLGAFLSGGLDSSAVVAAMASLKKDKVRTFSIGFKEKAFDELAHARRVARHLKSDHTEAVVAPDAMALLPRLAWHYDEPFADASAIPTFYVSQEARRHVTVALTGDGGDELFGGYDRYRANLAFASWKRLPGPLRAGAAWAIRRLPGHDEKSLGRMARRFLEVSGDDPFRRYAFWAGFFDPARRQALMTEEALRASTSSGPEPFGWLAEQGRATGFDELRDQMEALDLGTYLPCDILTKVDLASMAVSLECRSPFLDHTMVEFAMRIPPEQKVTLRGGKLCLKRALAPLLPWRNVNRAKMGFGVPVSRWLRREMSGFLRETLLSEKALGRGLFRPEPLRALVEDHVAGRAFHGYRLWALLMLELWQKTWVDPADVPEAP
jgi:asparagine synthase (glutamine-hydrolysing)